MYPECSLPFPEDVTVALLSFSIPFYSLPYFFQIHVNILMLKSTTSKPLLSLGFPADLCMLFNFYVFFLMNVVHFNVSYILWFVGFFWYKLYVIIIIFFLHGLGRLTCSGIDALPSFPGASAIPSSPGFVDEGVFRESGVVHSFEMVDPILFVFESHVLYSRDL